MSFVCWHYEIDTLPHLERAVVDGQPTPAFDLHIPVGVYSEAPQTVNVTFDVQIDDGASFSIGFDTSPSKGFVRSITLCFIKELRKQEGRIAARWYLEMEEKLGNGPNQYYEAVVKNVPEGALVCYSIKIRGLDQASQTLHEYKIYACAPTFTYEDIFAISDGSGEDKRFTGEVWCDDKKVSDERIKDAFALYYKDDGKYHHFRVDLPDIRSSRLKFELTVNKQRYAWSDDPGVPFHPESLPSLPIINPFADYVTVSIPRKSTEPVVKVSWRGIDYEVKEKVNVGRTRIMFIHFCIQGLNDLFGLPDKSYVPPRTFMQVTMRDELSKYSSRPNSPEGPEGDGYSYTLDAHRSFGIPYLWTFNGGVLGLLGHDSQGVVTEQVSTFYRGATAQNGKLILIDYLEQIKADIASGGMDPTIAGFPAHRLPYYQEETNRYSVQYGIDIIRNVLGRCNKVYYPDSRLYKQIFSVIDALKSAGVEYVVVDGSTGFRPYCYTAELNENGRGIYPDDQYVWQDRASGLYILYITDELREKMFASKYVADEPREKKFASDMPEEVDHGKLALDLRHKFFYFAAHPKLRRNHLLIYSDDADKASGNGWFDGGYAGPEQPFKEQFASALEWIKAHPWIKAITSADLDPARDCVGTINMQTAICPSVDPGGASSSDTYGKQIHFDAWYDNWKLFRAVWLGQTLEGISQSVEFAIIDWPQEYRNRLYSLAQMAFSMGLHESQWNKQPVESIYGRDANNRCDVKEPEDFVIAASLQLRNAQVYLNAAVWAKWALDDADSGVYLNNGPVIEHLRDIRYRSESWRRSRYHDRTVLDDPLCWDRDLLQNVILYNRDILVVMDRNGGRITHLFAIYDGKPCCVSGTFKCYQFLFGERTTQTIVNCDGEALQNTVYTPNHAYIACDVHHSRGVIGKKFNPKTNAEDERCYYPDNFNEYGYSRVEGTTVEWAYEQTEPMQTFNLDQFRARLREDRKARLHGYGQPVVYHKFAPFRKRISLVGRTVEIRYFDTERGHVVANEFTMDLNDSMMSAKRQSCKPGNNPRVMRISNEDGICIDLELLDNCEFTRGTLQGESNRRLHRVMTDCIELVSPAGGDFAYRIRA